MLQKAIDHWRNTRLGSPEEKEADREVRRLIRRAKQAAQDADREAFRDYLATKD